MVVTDLLLCAYSSELLFFWTFIDRRHEFYSVGDRLRSHCIKTGCQSHVTTFVLLILRSLIKIRGLFTHWSGLEIAQASCTICRLLERLFIQIWQEVLQSHILSCLAEPTTNIAVPTSRSIDHVCTTLMLVRVNGVKNAFDCEIGSH